MPGDGMASPRGMGRGHARARQGRQVHRRGARGGGGAAGRGAVAASVDARDIFSPPAKTLRGPAVRASYAAGDGSRGAETTRRKGAPRLGSFRRRRSIRSPSRRLRRARSISRPSRRISSTISPPSGPRTRGGQGRARGCCAGPAAAHRRTDSGGSAASERASEPRETASPRAAQGWHLVRSPAAAWRRRGACLKTNTSTASTVSSLATPPFPGRHALSLSSDASMAAARDDESGDPWSDPWGGRG